MPVSDEDYACTLEELRALMELRGAEALEKVARKLKYNLLIKGLQVETTYDGVEGLCRRLKTDPVNGLPNTSKELEHRRKNFGKNEIPPAPSKSFLRLAWEAMQVCVVLENYYSLCVGK